MAIEVELKAHVDNPVALEAVLKRRCRRIRSFSKEDRYFTDARGDVGHDFRLRIDGERAIVTYKDKRFSDGGEVSDEREFGVDDAAAFLDLAARMGCQEYLRKHKYGVEYHCEAADGLALQAELVTVDPLGSFIELEVVLRNDPSAEDVAAWHRRLRGVLIELGVDPAQIEPRTYSALLTESGQVG